MYSLWGSDIIYIKREQRQIYLIGECYINGVMKGEAMKEHSEGKHEKEVFHIY
jgi:hypothetical protein